MMAQAVTCDNVVFQCLPDNHSVAIAAKFPVCSYYYVSFTLLFLLFKQI